MAVSNQLNPSFAGNVKALSFSTPASSGSFGGNASIKAVLTSGGNKVDVFGTTNGFSGTMLGARITARGDGNGTVDVFCSGGTLCRIVKGSAGAVTGCAIFISGKAGTHFGASDRLQVSNNSVNDCLVELIFVPKETES